MMMMVTRKIIDGADDSGRGDNTDHVTDHVITILTTMTLTTSDVCDACEMFQKDLV